MNAADLAVFIQDELTTLAACRGSSVQKMEINSDGGFAGMGDPRLVAESPAMFIVSPATGERNRVGCPVESVLRDIGGCLCHIERVDVPGHIPWLDDILRILISRNSPA